MSVKLWGGAHIAATLGVTPAAFANWRRRYNNTPPPTHEVVDGMPLWDAHGLGEWAIWCEARRRRVGYCYSSNDCDKEE